MVSSKMGIKLLVNPIIILILQACGDCKMVKLPSSAKTHQNEKICCAFFKRKFAVHFLRKGKKNSKIHIWLELRFFHKLGSYDLRTLMVPSQKSHEIVIFPFC